VKMRSARLMTAIIAVSLTVGCATSASNEVAQPQATVAVADVPPGECGLGLSLTHAPGGGQSSRAATLQELLELRQELIDTNTDIDTDTDHSQLPSHEDVIRTLEVALANLPDAEAKATPESPLRVEAVDERGVNLGSFFISFNGSGYVITSLAITHVDGAPCPT